MKVPATNSRLFRTVTAISFSLIAPLIQAQTVPAHAATPSGQNLRSPLYIYDLDDGSSHLVYTADTIWEAPNWSPDGKYLISNSNGGIYKLILKQDGSQDGVAEPLKLAIPTDYQCNNDKAISPDGKKLAFSATVAPNKGSQVYLADADGNNIRQMTSESPSYFHGWSPDNKTLAFVAQRNGGGQYDIYRLPAASGTEQQLTSNIHQDDGPDYSPDGKWIYINSDRSGKQAVWRFPANGAGPNDAEAELVVNDGLQDWFPHISPDGQKMVYIGYPAGTPTHNPRNVPIQVKLVAVNHDKVAATQKILVQGIGGQGTMNVNSWAPDSTHFAYVTYEALP
jgi:TolB protein